MLSILIVEDSLTILQMASTALEGASYRVLQATNGEEALQIAADQQPQVILLDVILPKMNGYQVCRQLKSLPETAHIPVVMLTSKSKESDRYWGFEQGADDYIVKPIEIRTLLDVIRQHTTQAN